MVDIEQYLAQREPPDASPVMYQKWRDLTFLHFSVDPAEVQTRLPEGLTVDTFPDENGRERAWISLTPFLIYDIRLRGLPPIPGLDTSPETNLRTYVHREGRRPGVWFFSLDIANLAAVAAARFLYGLPYYRANMRVVRNDTVTTYTSKRWDVEGQVRAVSEIRAVLGNDLGEAQPGTLDFFLIERYILYGHRQGELVEGRVNHRPYPLAKATILSEDQTLIEAAGLECKGWERCHFSRGVDVKVYGPSAAG